MTESQLPLSVPVEVEFWSVYTACFVCEGVGIKSRVLKESKRGKEITAVVLLGIEVMFGYKLVSRFMVLIPFTEQSTSPKYIREVVQWYVSTIKSTG